MSPTTPTTTKITTLSTSCSRAPLACVQLAKAQATPSWAAAGTVVTEMKTPIKALALDRVAETTPATPARTATITE